MTELNTSRDDVSAPDRKGLFATLGVLGAVLASACCIVPLVLATLGISGAWIGNLTALEPYKPRPECVEGSYCARPQSSRITKAALWGASILVLLSITVNWWAPLFY